ncbi:2'-5'-oligoadenylate synthase 1A-like isoform X2 [Oscarella lobularis]|uniref:2'-5'-oligoadenylate synthase 1A-like isoform X2 n=1 Tax=Oscarella lobularis TaxID=121494 RepID=UPI003313C727
MVDAQLSAARPPQHKLDNHQRVVNFLVRYLHNHCPFRVSEVVESGSLGQGTTTSEEADIDLVVMSQEVPKEDNADWLPRALEALKTALRRGEAKQYPNISNMPNSMLGRAIPCCSDWERTRFALQFKCGGYDVDLLPTYDWSRDPEKYEGLYKLCVKYHTQEQYQWYSRGAAKLQVEFVSHQRNEVKDLIRIVKYWSKKRAYWSYKKYKPSSYLITLLVIKASENTGHMYFDRTAVLSEFCRLVRQPPPLRISWSKYNDPETYSFGEAQRVIQDPANPVNNVARSGIGDWSEFPRNVEKFRQELGIPY